MDEKNKSAESKINGYTKIDQYDLEKIERIAAHYKAILADSGMIILSCLIASYLVNKNTNSNIIVLISSIYLLPYLLYN
jgi:hypothetical protein